MKNLVLVSFLTIFSCPNLVLAHGGGHSHEVVSSQKAEKIATDAVLQKIKDKKLGDSWKSIKPETPTKKEFGHGPEWVISFHNLKEKDEKKRKLYVFVSLGGEVLGVNFNGK